MNTGKVIDVIIKSSYCKVCEFLNKSKDEDIDDRRKQHEAVCQCNHAGSAGKMEVDGIIEMFHRSLLLYQLKYIQYIGDGDSKIYKFSKDVSEDFLKTETKASILKCGKLHRKPLFVVLIS